jgi:molecular chaperone GrpE
MFKSKKEKLEKEILKTELGSIDNPGNETGENVKLDEEVVRSESDEKLGELEKELESYKDQYLRKAAEFENYKRRTESEISNVYRYANENLIYELLPVLDDFDRIAKTWDENHDLESFKKGIEMVHDKFKGILEKQGLKKMEAEGNPFDVNLHDAMLQVPAKDIEPNTVTEVIENGFFLKDKVLRHAKVIVSKLPEDDNSKK